MLSSRSASAWASPSLVWPTNTSLVRDADPLVESMNEPSCPAARQRMLNLRVSVDSRVSSAAPAVVCCSRPISSSATPLRSFAGRRYISRVVRNVASCSTLTAWRSESFQSARGLVGLGMLMPGMVRMISRSSVSSVHPSCPARGNISATCGCRILPRIIVARMPACSAKDPIRSTSSIAARTSPGSAVSAGCTAARALASTYSVCSLSATRCDSNSSSASFISPVRSASAFSHAVR